MKISNRTTWYKSLRCITHLLCPPNKFVPHIDLSLLNISPISHRTTCVRNKEQTNQAINATGSVNNPYIIPNSRMGLSPRRSKAATRQKYRFFVTRTNTWRPWHMASKSKTKRRRHSTIAQQQATEINSWWLRSLLLAVIAKCKFWPPFRRLGYQYPCDTQPKTHKILKWHPNHVPWVVLKTQIPTQPLQYHVYHPRGAFNNKEEIDKRFYVSSELAYSCFHFDWSVILQFLLFQF